MAQCTPKSCLLVYKCLMTPFGCSGLRVRVTICQLHASVFCSRISSFIMTCLVRHLRTPTIRTVHPYRVQNAELPRCSAQSFSTQLHTTLLTIFLSCPLDTPAKRGTAAVMPTKGFKTGSQLHSLTSSRCHQSHINQSLYQMMMIPLVCQYSKPEKNAPYSAFPFHRQ